MPLVVISILEAKDCTGVLRQVTPASSNHPQMGADRGNRPTDDETKGEGRETMITTTTTTTRGSASCLGRTCLKWQADGELTPLDLRLVLERLAQVDQDATVLLDRTVEDLPCPSTS